MRALSWHSLLEQPALFLVLDIDNLVERLTFDSFTSTAVYHIHSFNKY